MKKNEEENSFRIFLLLLFDGFVVPFYFAHNDYTGFDFNVFASVYLKTSKKKRMIK